MFSLMSEFAWNCWGKLETPGSKLKTGRHEKILMVIRQPNMLSKSTQMLNIKVNIWELWGFHGLINKIKILNILIKCD